MQYPSQHRQIVKELLSGKFILDDSPLFLTLHQHRNFYDDFFEKTYGFFLEGKGEYFYLVSEETTENASRDFLLFLSVLCYEYHSRGKDIIQKISQGHFHLAEIERFLNNSSKRDLLKNTQAADLKPFLDSWQKRNLLEFTQQEPPAFRFKKSIDLFLHTAFALYEDRLKDDPKA